MTTLMTVARCAAIACALSAVPAQAATDAKIAGQFGLIGVWAMDCARPASVQNTYETMSVAADGTIDAVIDTQVTGIDGLSHLHALQLVDGGMVQLIWHSTVTGSTLTITIAKKGNLQHSWKSVQSDGKVLIDNGLFVASHMPTPWFEKCAAAPPAR
jgi:hypothetical protein